MKIIVIHGPNLNLLGTREPDIYGDRTLQDLNAQIASHASSLGIDVEILQTNHEGVIIDRIQEANGAGCAGVVINPGAYTHTSVAIEDAIRASTAPVVEVHISNIHAREDRRRQSVTAAACAGIISGFGFDSYTLAIDAIVSLSKS